MNVHTADKYTFTYYLKVLEVWPLKLDKGNVKVTFTRPFQL